jgi:mannose-1-phosphate guanylyltransferase
VILVGGEGRRLRPLTDTRPKPMMPLVDRPFVAHQLDHLRRFGLSRAVFSCGYRPRALDDHFGDGSAVGMRLRYVVDPQPLGTAGAVKNAEGVAAGDPLLVLNGDILTDLDLARVLAWHEDRGAEATVVLTPVDDPSAYGLVRIGGDGRVVEFVEKPGADQLVPGEPYLINAGTYVLRRRVLDLIPAGVMCSIERDVFPVLAARGALYGLAADAYWRDIGTPASYLQAHLDVLGGRVRTESPAGECFVGPGAEVDPAADVGGGACLGPRGRVAAGAVLTRCVVGEASAIGAGARLDGAILGAGVSVGAGAVLGPDVVVGDGAVIADRLRVPEGTRVPTGARLTEAGGAVG